MLLLQVKGAAKGPALGLATSHHEMCSCVGCFLVDYGVQEWVPHRNPCIIRQKGSESIFAHSPLTTKEFSLPAG